MESVAYANEPQIDLQQWLKERRKGIIDGPKFVKRHYGLECDLLVRTTELSQCSKLEGLKC